MDKTIQMLGEINDEILGRCEPPLALKVGKEMILTIPLSEQEAEDEITQGSFDEKQIYPSRVSLGIIKILERDENFLSELREIYKRFLSHDWGDYENGGNTLTKFNKENPEKARGIYETSWKGIVIDRDGAITEAYLPGEY